MNISRLFIDRPIATTLLMLALFLVGILGYRSLPIAALPQVDYPIIQVSVGYPGASAERMASIVAAPLERNLGQIPGLDQMTAVNGSGTTQITLRFKLDIALDVAEQSVQAALNSASSLLPNDLPSPPVYNKVNPADTPILTLAIRSATLPPTQVQDLIDTRIAQKIAQVRGVGLVSIGGGQRPAVRVEVNLKALSALNLSLEQVRSAIGAANLKQAKGTLQTPTRAMSIEGNDQLQTPESYRQLIIAWRGANASNNEAGAPIRLGDIATVIEGAENNQMAAWASSPNNEKNELSSAILLNIQRQPDANVIETVDRIRALLPEIQNTLPPSLSVEILSDRTEPIRASVDSVQKELLTAMALVIMVIFLFLRQWRATLIPAVAAPLSLVGTFAIMYWLGFSLNNLSLMALVIATGFVVDDAIVMVENIARHAEMGKPAKRAAIEGAREIGFTIVSLTVSLLAVLIPLLWMQDLVGRLFREFAVTLACAIGLSMLISLTLTPMMGARFLIPKKKDEDTTSSQPHEDGAFFKRVLHLYDQGLAWVFNHQKLTLWIAIGSFIATVLLYLAIPKGLFPTQDTGMIQAITQAPASVSFQTMAQSQSQLAQTLAEDPAVESIASIIGVDGVNTSLNTGRLIIKLKDKKERNQQGDSIDIVQKRLLKNAQDQAAMRLFLQPIQDITLEERSARYAYQFILSTSQTNDLVEWVPRWVQTLSQRPEFSGVASDQQNDGLAMMVRVDRDAAARLQVNMNTISQALYNAFGQRLISTIFTQSNLYRVVLVAKTLPSEQSVESILQSVYIATQTGKQVPLASVAQFEMTQAPLVLARVGQFPAVSISFALADKTSLGDALAAVREVEQSLIDAGMPSRIGLKFEGALGAFDSSLSNTVWLMLAAIVVMYIVLGVLYESWIHPLTILSTLPSAVVGAFLALFIMQRPLDLMAVIGVILLIGIVKKNAIMMVDFALVAERERGLSAREAIHQACLLRLRPILMTTFAALLGALPLMLGTGMGSELRQPLGITLVGGLLLSQLMTLFTTPVIYLAFHRWTLKKTVHPI